MPTVKPRVTITMSEEQLTQIEQYRTSHQYKNQTQAILSLIEAGFRELRSEGTADAFSSLTQEGRKLAREYAALDPAGRRLVQVVLQEERRRMDEEKARRQAKPLYEETRENPGEPRVIPFYFTPAAAGYASPTFGEDFDYIEVGGQVPPQADFAVRIQGDSMEPYLMDGATAYINRDPLADGDVGIFFLDGDMLCKQYHRDEEGNVHLRSLNRAREDADRFVPADSGAALTCFGRVILPHR